MPEAIPREVSAEKRELSGNRRKEMTATYMAFISEIIPSPKGF